MEIYYQNHKKNIVYNFRENDIKNGGEGAPLTPIFHQLILKQNRIQVPSCVLKYWRNFKYNNCR